MRRFFPLLTILLVLAGCGASETSSVSAIAVCADGKDNDGDGLVDFGADPGCRSASDTSESDLAPAGKRSRYAMNNQCWALRSNASGAYVLAGDNGFAASAASLAEATPFFMKPTALGKYMLYSPDRVVLAASGGGLSTLASASATDAAEWTVLGVGDTTAYPETPAYHVEPSKAQVDLWHGFTDPDAEYDAFTLTASADASLLGVDGEGQLVTLAEDDGSTSFSFEPTTGCAVFPEASSDFSGVPFAGKTSDGRVLGHADVHVHISATEFLGGAEWGRPFHKFGVEHALPSCAGPDAHGFMGELDLLGAAYGGDTDGHATDGWPEFTEWPARDSLTHEAIYWKWLERSWASGLRVVVNDLVDNTTLCELERNAKGDPTQDCNSMNTAGRQAGTMYAMEDYIDAQYGGRGKGFFQIVHDAAEARQVIEDGKMAVILGIEISNLFDCQLTYNPLRTQEPWQEQPGAPTENHYNCTTEEGLPHSILTQMQRIWDWGVRQVISIHEFDNAFGGNGIFNDMILNVGNKENSGGIPSSDLALITNGEPDSYLLNFDQAETPTGEFWTTYDCPVEGETEGFSGYLWDDAGGSVQTFSQFPFCVPMGQGGRNGGITPCYPQTRQCNARWMTPAGLYTYSKLMEFGFMFDFDHMAVGMKTQTLELAEAQNPVYPLVSTHGTFGGITLDQARRVLRGGGYLYPSNGSSRGFVTDMDETYGLYQEAFVDVPEDQRPIFGFGYGTDTNGLSSQSRPRGDIEAGKELVYPFNLFDGSQFDVLDEFDAINGISFHQPSSRDADGELVRTWHEDEDGNAHHGMISDFIQEIRIEATPEHLRHLYNSAEAYLQTWQRTEASSAAIRQRGLVMPDGVLRPAPPEGDFAP